MIWKIQAMMAVALSIALAPAALVAQTGNQAAPTHQAAPSTAPAGNQAAPTHQTVPAGNQAAPTHQTAPAAPAPAAPAPVPPAASAAVPPATANPATQSDCEGGACDASLPHITIATPAPAPAPWPLQDRIKWLAVVLLVLVAYVGIWLAVSALHKIERQTRYVENAAQAAAESAKAALLLAQAQAQQAEAQAQAERPWILITTEPAHGVFNGFTVVATNRGRGPARVVSLAEEVTITKDESQLPAVPTFASEPRPLLVPMILLPGESTSIKSFSRDDVQLFCDSEERLHRVEDWEEKIYLYGTVTYRDLRSNDEKQIHETSWCCWYILGHKKNGMVMAGPPQYNRHS